MKEYLKPADLMELLSVNQKTIYNYRKQGMPYERVNSRTYRYKREDVLEWMKARGNNGGIRVLG